MKPLSVEWEQKLSHQYFSKQGKYPINVSDWNTDRIDYFFLEEFGKKLKLDSVRIDNYNLDDESDFIANPFFQNLNGILVTNGTTALSVTIKAYKDMGCKRFLVISPAYFSIKNCVESCGETLIYFPLRKNNNYKVNINKFTRMVKDQVVDCVIITNPIFCVGRDLTNSELSSVLSVCKKESLSVIIDASMSGLSLSGNPLKNLKGISDNILGIDNVSIIDVPGKRLLLNGLKVAIIYSSSRITKLVQNNTKWMSGGVTSFQKKIAYIIHSENIKEIRQTELVIKRIQAWIRDKYILIKNIVDKTPHLTLGPFNSSYYLMIHLPGRYLDYDLPKLVETLCNDHGVIIILGQSFGFSQYDTMGFRINLLKDKSTLLRAISKISEYDFNKFYNTK